MNFIEKLDQFLHEPSEAVNHLPGSDFIQPEFKGTNGEFLARVYEKAQAKLMVSSYVSDESLGYSHEDINPLRGLIYVRAVIETPDRV